MDLPTDLFFWVWMIRGTAFFVAPLFARGKLSFLTLTLISGSGVAYLWWDYVVVTLSLESFHDVGSVLTLGIANLATSLMLSASLFSLCRLSGLFAISDKRLRRIAAVFIYPVCVCGMYSLVDTSAWLLTGDKWNDAWCEKIGSHGEEPDPQCESVLAQ